jgi:uncharacterized PurR-regulated membrane protein YhhQ (DUF165 family)
VFAVCYALTVVLANWLIGNWGRPPQFPGAPYTIPVWPWPYLLAPSGVLAVGLAFTLRDLTQEWLGRRAVVVAILVGAGLSYLVTSNRDLAVASAVAFLVSEFCDFAVYTRIRERARTTGAWLGAVAASNLVGAIIDSVIFLWLAFGSLDFLAGQIVGKLLMTALALPVLAWLRRWAIPRSSRPADEPTVPEIA